MKTFLQTMFFFLLVIQICFGQVYQQNREANPNNKKSLLDRQNKHFPIIDKDILLKTSQEFPTSVIPDKFRIGNDSLDANGTSYPFVNDRFYPKGHKTSFPPTNKMFFPQSQLYVIDTAIVISEQDTTRHLYSFNASAKRTSDITQNLIGSIWVDNTRHTNTYDANNNMLTDLYEDWENGQWVGGWRYTYTYDANNNMLSYLRETWENGQLVIGSRSTYTYDINNNMLSYLHERWENGQWVHNARSTYTYDTNNNMITDLYENWENGQWVIGSRYNLHIRCKQQYAFIFSRALGERSMGE